MEVTISGLFQIKKSLIFFSIQHYQIQYRSSIILYRSLTGFTAFRASILVPFQECKAQQQDAPLSWNEQHQQSNSKLYDRLDVSLSLMVRSCFVGFVWIHRQKLCSILSYSIYLVLMQVDFQEMWVTITVLRQKSVILKGNSTSLTERLFSPRTIIRIDFSGISCT
jgi:hypothetical protein